MRGIISLAHELAHSLDCKKEVPGMSQAHPHATTLSAGILSTQSKAFKFCSDVDLTLLPLGDTGRYIKQAVVGMYDKQHWPSEIFAIAVGAYCKNPQAMDAPLLKSYIEQVAVPYFDAVAAKHTAMAAGITSSLRHMHYGMMVGNDFRAQVGDWQEARGDARVAARRELSPQADVLVGQASRAMAKEMERAREVVARLGK